MLGLFDAHPGRIFVVATLLPLLAFAVLLSLGFAKRLRGKNHPGALDRFAGVAVLGAMLLSTGCAGVGLAWFLADAHEFAGMPATMESRWAERFDWVRIGGYARDTRPALALEVGYRIDHLTALMFAMVTAVGTLIVLFSTGYMKDELAEVHDHAAHVHRRGRYGRFFLYMALFAFAMLNLLVADNLFQVFVSWELVGVASFFLIGFYTERGTATAAANKAFVVNRIGDAGFLVGLAVAWSTFGTFNIRELAAAFEAAPAGATLTLMGLGIFAGCVGKSAQMPLHTWLPDAMEGPTPVSALIHAATMVAAGVYLVGRCYLLFTPTVLLVIASIGAITLFASALVALVQTDIKRVLAYSTCSQLGYMMLALGLGGWTAGLLHLLTHAFFKALLFLGAGSVIHATHHEQDLLKMGGLRRKLPITAYTMLVGVAAIVGVPLFSGWYSKDRILAHALGNPTHPLLMLLPVATVALTGFYMARLWLLAFAGVPRHASTYERAHESPPTMTIPLALLAACSLGIAWGWPIWDADASELESLLRHAEPQTRFVEASAHAAHEAHTPALLLGLLGAALGVGTAWGMHRAGHLAKPTASAWRTALLRRMYFDELYDRLFTRPTVAVAEFSRALDKRPADVPGVDLRTLDGTMNGVGQLALAAGTAVRPAQSGRLRTYVLGLALTLAVALSMLARFTR